MKAIVVEKDSGKSIESEMEPCDFSAVETLVMSHIPGIVLWSEENDVLMFIKSDYTGRSYVDVSGSRKDEIINATKWRRDTRGVSLRTHDVEVSVFGDDGSYVDSFEMQTCN